jgi:hypothetical protein
MPPAPATSNLPADFEAIATQLKGALLKRDQRIESLELENRRLRDQIERLLKEQAARVTAPAVVSEHPVKSAEPKEAPAKALFEADFVRLAAPTTGLHSDGWAEPKVRVSALSARPLKEATLEVWLRPVKGASAANFTVKVNGQERCRVQPRNGAVTLVSVPLNATANAVFELEIDCDFLSPVDPPDTRTLSYVMRGVKYE